MKTVYANTEHPGLVKWSIGIAIALGIFLYILYISMEDKYKLLLYIAAVSFVYGGMFIGFYKLRVYEVNEEEDTITDYKNKKYTLHISNLTTATYKESKKGRFRSLFLHDAGTGFMDIRTSKEKADKIVAQLLNANTAIEVKHANYL